MRIGIPAETRSGETRVAATPETVKKLAAKHQVIVQSGAGLNASVIDDNLRGRWCDHRQRGRRLWRRRGPQGACTECGRARVMKRDAVLIGMLNPFDAENIAAMASA
ncbi:hypothetical protein LP420_23575 [Massilia sp. B-10]|nr:hypothetical protein LP420_23575 [Massilia sp. B-10]